MTEENKYWGSLEELYGESALADSVGKEFPTPPEKEEITEIERRDFLKVMGAGILMAATACTRKPVEKIIPYVNQPEEVTPGIANWYASVCQECSAGCGILVKTREGRPIKLEGNPSHPVNQGGLCARGQASLLNLYDPDRLHGPMASGAASSWTDVDKAIAAKLKEARSRGKGVAVLTGALTSPTTQKLISEFIAGFPRGRFVAYEGVVPEEIALGQEKSYGQKITPRYRFDKASFILSFGADFLGTYLSPVEFAKQFSKGRRVAEGKMSRFVAFEGALSLTGTNADLHIPIKPGDELPIAAALAHEIIIKKGVGAPGDTASALRRYSIESVSQQTGIAPETLRAVANDLLENHGKGLVVGGGIKCKNAVALQTVVNLLNSVLENDGTTVDYTNPSLQAGSSHADLVALIRDMKEGKIGALLIHKTNPVYLLPEHLGFKEALARVPLVVSFSDRADETGSLAHFICPDAHYLESWNDSSPREGLMALAQPTINPLYDTRSFQDSLLGWMGKNGSWYDYLTENWTASLWNEALKTGVSPFPTDDSGSAPRSFNASSLRIPKPSEDSDRIHLALYPSIPQYDGRSANNAWLQELPNPISKITWDNYLSVGPVAAKEMALKDGDVVRVSGPGISLELPAQIQPKLHPQAVMAAVGYGRVAAGKLGNGIGVNVFPFQTGVVFPEWSGQPVTLEKTGKRVRLAITQSQSNTMGRPVVKDTTYAGFLKDPASGNEKAAQPITLWPKHEFPGNRWGMAIDTNSCNGCGACMIGCQSENNVPVVGKDQVLVNRDMHWLRIDRYYKGDEENPDVAFQPMLCQHCENAPCETVCPVLATTHNDEGLNTMIYNRCVGTRYCANNCPYKVRRFNYYEFAKKQYSTEPLQLVLNPDITVREKGVMEKCTFCIQRIRTAKDNAKDEGRVVADGEIKTACQQSCPTDAIVFGNLNDPESLVSKMKASPRGYHVLEELNTVPQVTYLTKVRNT
ncbi:MAG: TAT-variant-translocated molybdopterin oxidoreductase [Deltaproteobacteria bacterium]|nr:TAT-variant-translocated molybdopterin oxidoreductase [Deltaproteobacteria bacterium]